MTWQELVVECPHRLEVFRYRLCDSKDEQVRWDLVVQHYADAVERKEEVCVCVYVRKELGSTRSSRPFLISACVSSLCNVC
jgi:hypothetical protein